jgi:hypothetical protein
MLGLVLEERPILQKGALGLGKVSELQSYRDSNYLYRSAKKPMKRYQ